MLFRAKDASVIGTMGIIIAQILNAKGVDAKKVFNHVGLEINSLNSPRARIPLETMNRLVALSIRLTKDPCLGLHMADYFSPTSYYALSFTLFASSTLEEYIQRLIRYRRLITGNSEVMLEMSDDRVRLGLQPSDPSQYGPISMDGWAAMTLKNIRLAYRLDFCPIKVDLARPTPVGYEEEYSRFFGVPVNFAMPASALYFNIDDLKETLPGANTELLQANEKVVISELSQLDQDDLPNRIRGILIDLLPTGSFSKEHVARELNMSVRTLHNKLEAAGKSFQEILDSTRCELARQYMQSADITVKEVGYLLGFSDSCNFTRAFKRWMGISPSQYRTELATHSQ